MSGARGLLRGRLRSLSAIALTAVVGSQAAAGCGSRTGLRWDQTPLEAGVPPPVICPVYDINRVRLGEVSKVDLLFVIDNSISMADKQELLEDAIPPLVQRLANPLCVDGSNPPEERSVDTPTAPCPDGFDREFEAINDIHIGIITSSLGGRGGNICSFGAEDDDHARLMGTLERGSGLETYANLGFLAWDPDQELEPPGENDIHELERDFQAMLGAVGDTGCGFEAPLEAMFRFLVDPTPPARVERGSCGAEPCTVKTGVDNALLSQRAAFLRPDSLVAVVLLSDEDDCSVVDMGPALALTTTHTLQGEFHLPRATSACQANPNDPCCRSCASGVNPAGCVSIANDAECRRGPYTEAGDPFNLRCHDQQRRFGIDFLYPTARYAIGLSELEICPNSRYRDGDCLCRAAIARAQKLGLPAPACTRAETGEPVRNPLFQNLTGDAGFGREPAQVFFAGIVGVPWQDIATDESLTDPAVLEYLTADQLAEVDPDLGMSRWDVILGDLDTATPPADPFMVATSAERTGENPITGESMFGSDSLNARANEINGHERAIPDNNDLQYACTFPLITPRECRPDGEPCDCAPGIESSTSPLCQDPANPGPGGATQFFAKAYPGRRHLDALKRFGKNAILASICPKLIERDDTDLAFGYRPAVSGLVKRLRCTSLDAEFERDPNSVDYGTVPCHLVAVRQVSGECVCNEALRQPINETLRLEVEKALDLRGVCGGATTVSCDSFCACEVPQARGVALNACQNKEGDAPVDSELMRPVDGWCYVDPEAGFGNPALIESCPPANFKNLRVLGGANAKEGEELFVACPSGCIGPTADAGSE